MEELQDFFNTMDSDRQETVADRYVGLVDEQIIDPIHFPAEVDGKGNVEYKLKLGNLSQDRFQHLLTQMKWRMKEGEYPVECLVSKGLLRSNLRKSRAQALQDLYSSQVKLTSPIKTNLSHHSPGNGQAIYRIGVTDDGACVGLNERQANLSLRTFHSMARQLNASVKLLNEITVKVKSRGKIHQRTAYELSVKASDKNESLPELRVALLGATNSGKSSLMSLLTQGVLDNGNGLARSALGFRFRHELISGHTSSVLREIYGYSDRNEVVNYRPEGNVTCPEEILEQAKHLVHLLDLAGSRKHLKTTIYGLVCNAANFALLVLNASAGLSSTSREHLEILLSLDLPFLIVINKIDLVDGAECGNLVHSLANLVGSRSLQTIASSADIDDHFAAGRRSIPLVQCSCVTGESIPLIYEFISRFINETPEVFINSVQQTVQPFEFLVQDVFYQTDETCVIGGLLLRDGQLKRNDEILVGPTASGQFVESRVLSIQRYKVTMNGLKENQSGSLEIELNNKENSLTSKGGKLKIRKGMVIVPKSADLSALRMGKRFKVRLNVRYLKNTIKRGFQCKIYVDNIKQSVCIEQIEGVDEIACTGQYVVVLRFLKHLEVIRIGSSLFLHESSLLKATGSIIEIC